MPSEFPGRPRIEKGALLVYESQTPGTPPRKIFFQYNPEQLRRSLANRTPPREAGNVGNAREDVLRVAGPPVETISLSIILNTADQLAEPNENRSVVELGLHPVLATLELLLYPATARVSEIERMAEQGEVQVSAGDLPLVVLSFGRQRVVPVLITSFAINEELFDPNLNPIHARVDLNFRVLTYMEFTTRSVGRDAFISYQKQKEALAEAGAA